MASVDGMIIAIVVSYAVATCKGHDEFHVGAADGWVPHPTEPFNHWAQRIRFHVSDRLVFEYKKDEDSVLVVSKKHYDMCDDSNPYLKLSGGKSIFDLLRPGLYFFISGNHTRCEEGEKVVVSVMAKRVPPLPLPLSPPPVSHPPPFNSPKDPSSNGTAPTMHQSSHNTSPSSSAAADMVLGFSKVHLVILIGLVLSA